MNFLLAFIAFNIIVIVHELGHFIAAKKFGIKVLEFSLFIGPKIASIRKGETEYSLRLFPVMAYVKMEGEEEDSDSARAFRNKPKHARAIVAAAAPLANLLFAVVILTFAFSFSGFSTTRVSRVEEGKAAYKAGIRPGDTILSYDGKRTFVPMEVMQFLFTSEGQPVGITFKRGEDVLNGTIAPDLIPEHVRYMLGIMVPNSAGPDSNVISQLFAGGPAEKAGLKPGDRIVALNDTPISDKKGIDSFLQQNGQNPIVVTVSRDGATVRFELTPMVETIPRQYDIGLEYSYMKGNVLAALQHSLVYILYIVRSVGYSLIWLISGRVALNQMMGPVGIVSTIGMIVEQSPTLIDQLLSLLQMTAFFSTAVGVTQFIPFPMLDGNKLLLILVEAVRGKPIPAEKEAFISMVGFAVLILFAIYAFYNDIMRLVGG